MRLAWMALLAALTACDGGDSQKANGSGGAAGAGASGGSGGAPFVCQCGGCPLGRGGDSPGCLCPPYPSSKPPEVTGSAPTPSAPVSLGSPGWDSGGWLAALPGGGVVMVGGAPFALDLSGGPPPNPNLHTDYSHGVFLAWLGPTGKVERIREDLLPQAVILGLGADSSGALRMTQWRDTGQSLDGVAVSPGHALVRLDPTGKAEWSQPLPAGDHYGAVMTVWADGDALVAVSTGSALELVRFDATGKKLWQNQQPYTGTVGLSSLPSGEALALFRSGDKAATLVSVDASGKVLERVKLNGSVSDLALATVPDGRAAIVGNAIETLDIGGQSLDGPSPFIAHVDATGTLTKIQKVDEVGGTAALTNAGDVLVWFARVDRLVLRSYKSDGSTWRIAFDNRVDFWISRVAHTGGVVVAGSDVVVSGGFEQFLDLGAQKLESRGCVDAFVFRVPMQ